jgi:hypothetical protein
MGAIYFFDGSLYNLFVYPTTDGNIVLSQRSIASIGYNLRVAERQPIYISIRTRITYIYFRSQQILRFIAKRLIIAWLSTGIVQREKEVLLLA